MAKNLEAVVKISSTAGLHGRPGALLVTLARKHPKAKIFLQKSKEKVEATSILSLLALGVKKGEKVRVLVEGDKAETIMNELKLILAGKKG